MGGKEDGGAVSGGRKTYWRSASWSASRTLASEDVAGRSSGNEQPRRCPAPPLTPRSQNSKARSCLPPLQPLSITRRSLEEWPKAGSDDVGEWPQPPTPSGRVAAAGNKPGEGLKLDLSVLHSQVKKDQLASFNKECSKVADHIYLGGDSVARNREILRQNGITHVLNCVGFICPEYFKSDLVYKTLWLQDSPTEDITSILYDVFDYFEDVREQGGRVFVHCCQGVSRSASLVIAYLMWREGQSFDDAFQYVKAARGIADPNMGFTCQLLQCQKRVHAIPLSPNSVLRLYRMAPHSSYDALHLVPKMLSDPSPAALDSRGAFILHVLSSIYVWIGRDCHPVMEKDAKAAAFQVVRYERVQGPIVTMVEGEEPIEFWQAFSTVSISSDHNNKVSKEVIESASKIGEGKRRVEAYNVDLELFYKAITGGVVPPFPSSGPGQETHLPIRESNWSILRRKFVTGALSRVCSDSVPVQDSDHHMSRVQFLTTESSTSPPYLSPSSLSSDSTGSSKSRSDSPSISPSTSASPLLTPSHASFNLPDTLLPTAKPLRFSSTFEPLKPCLEAVHSPSKRLAQSIAERRGGFSPLKLPTLTKDGQLLSRESAREFPDYTEGPLDSVDNIANFDCNALNGGTGAEPDPDLKGSTEPSSNCSNKYVDSKDIDLPHDVQLLPRSTAFANISPASTDTKEILVYCWPSKERIMTFGKEDLHSGAVLLFLTSDAVGSGLHRVLYLWIGSCVEQDDLQTHRRSGRELNGANKIDWERVGYDFLSFMGLSKDIPIKVIREEEPEDLLELFDSINTMR